MVGTHLDSKQVCREVDMLEHKVLGMVRKALHMGCKVLGMEAHKLVCKVVAHMEVGTLGCKVVGKVLHRAPHMEVGILVCKALDKQACMVGDIRVCKVDKLEDMVHNNRYHNGWNSLSTRVLTHPKKATRLEFQVVFSLKDSLC